jgi:cell surface protein SprA
MVPRDFWRLFPFYRRLEAAAGATPPRATAGTPAGRPSAQTPAAPADSTAGEGRRGFDPARSLARLPRTLFLAVTGITDVTTTYRGTLGASASGLTGGAYSLLAGLTGRAPSLPFRFGFARRLPLDGRLNNDTLRLNLEDRLTDQHVFEARTQLEPFRQLRVGLVMQTQFTRDETTPYTYPDTAPGVPSTLTRGFLSTRGTGSSSVHAFGATYESLLARHVERLQADLAGTPDEQGRIVSEALARTGLTEDFLAEFGRGVARYGPRGLFAIPLPGWDVTYSGLSTWPVFRSLATSVTLRHNYSASAQSSYQSFTTPPVTRTVGATTLVTPAVEGPSDEATSVTSSQAFQPLIGLQVTWRGGIQTTLNFERSDNFALQTQAAQVTEKTIENVRLEVQWSRTGLRLFGRRRLNNNLTFNLSGSFADDVTYNRLLASDAIATVLGTALNEAEPIRLRRYQFSPRIGYTISNQVTASLFVTYSRSEPLGNNLQPTTDFDGGVSLRILFSN